MAAWLWGISHPPLSPPQLFEVILFSAAPSSPDASIPTALVRQPDRPAAHRQLHTIARTAIEPRNPPSKEPSVPGIQVSHVEPIPEAQTTALIATPPSDEPLQQPASSPQYDAAYLHNPPPAYPPLAKRLNMEGSVIVRVLVDTAGRPAQVELERSSGASILDQAALKAVRQWSFVPARQGGEAVAAWVNVPIRFHLE
jgi:protein TonB